MESKADQEVAVNNVKELLLLAEKKKLAVEDLSVSRITGQYLDNLKDAKDGSMEELTEFLTAAVKLLSLKVKTLLPTPQEESWEEEEEIAELLASHLLEYKTFKEAAGVFRSRFESQQKTYVRGNAFSDYVSSVSSSSSLEGLGLGDLLNALEKVLQRDAVQEQLAGFQVPTQEFKVADKIAEVSRLVAARGASGIEFGMLFSHGAQKGEIIATFLALLELVRLRKVRIIQEKTLGTILIYDLAEEHSPA